MMLFILKRRYFTFRLNVLKEEEGAVLLFICTTNYKDEELILYLLSIEYYNLLQYMKYSQRHILFFINYRVEPS